MSFDCRSTDHNYQRLASHEWLTLVTFGGLRRPQKYEEQSPQGRADDRGVIALISPALPRMSHYGDSVREKRGERDGKLH